MLAGYTMTRFVCKTNITLYACKEQIEVRSGIDQGKLDFACKQIQRGALEVQETACQRDTGTKVKSIHVEF